ncbi:MAG: hypothetical protein FRX48_09300 [Lasallia pustulata]|uniref:ATP-dependent DNA helicase n=1 Tax=Lasallia pustulata TaxID=136370 RepID=A0A5M8PE69_9LECA|nr:MAG: hypothetical protein FRX48_09300 [Lasallia pustulata]
MGADSFSNTLIRDDADRAALGRRIILPSSYTGGDRHMQQLFQDSMAIVRHFGKPTLFVTFTANLNWVEIQHELLPDQSVNDRPDLVAHVFQLKKKALLLDLQTIFSRYQGSVWTIEYQKQDQERIDQVVRAELPDPAMDPDGTLTEIVKSQLTHGPCGVHDPKAPCMVDTSDGSGREDGYPLYQRCQDGRTWVKRACWHMFEFSAHSETPPVLALQIHLPGQQLVRFPDNPTTQELLDAQESAQTTLTTFFTYNQLYADRQQYLYHEFPAHYVYHKAKSKRYWTPRTRGFSIGQMYHCSPITGEKFYLRLLLTVVQGPKSYEDLRTVDGQLCQSFQAACFALGLLEDDREWVSCFTEAVLFISGTALRTLLVTSLVHGGVTDLNSLWNRFCANICDDLPHCLQSFAGVPVEFEDPHYDYGLFLINALLTDFDKTLASYQLPQYTLDWTLIIWDEVPMQHKYNFTAVNFTLCDLQNQDVLFGGIPTVLGGDFAQILPVVRKGIRAFTVEANLQRSVLWSQFHILTLKQNIRVCPDPANQVFAAWLAELPYDSQ